MKLYEKMAIEYEITRVDFRGVDVRAMEFYIAGFKAAREMALEFVSDYFYSVEPKLYRGIDELGEEEMNENSKRTLVREW